MSKIRDALSVLPARPAVLIAPLIVVGVLTVYYWNLYAKCHEIKHAREAFSSFVQAQTLPGQFSLAEFTDFDWDQVRIVGQYQPRRETVACPFDWNWHANERETLIDKKLLGVMFFLQREKIVRYVEFRTDEIEFRGVESDVIEPSANFSLNLNSAATGLVLSLAPAPDGKSVD